MAALLRPEADADAELDGEERASFRAELAALFAELEVPGSASSCRERR
jgi:hypothetical protein